MLDDFGNWQNDEILRRLVKHFRKDYVADSIEEYGYLKRFEKEMGDKKEKILKSVLRKTRKLLKEEPLVVPRGSK